MNKASLSEKISLISKHWCPLIVAALNGKVLKLVKMSGVFPWRRQLNEDKLFSANLSMFLVNAKTSDLGSARRGSFNSNCRYFL
ncbi:hypothetical protein GC207_09470 [bacterium]|nr:hypothetical protein [bacterium]